MRRVLGTRGLAVVLAVTMCAAALVQPTTAAAQAGPDEGAVPELPDGLDRPGPQDPVDAPPVPELQSAPPIQSEGVEPAGAARFPQPGSAEVSLGAPGERRRAGDLPIRVAAGSERAASTRVAVEVLDRRTAQLSGVSGFVFRLSGAARAGLDADALEVAIDYSGFADAYGASYGERLRVVALPRCAVDPVRRPGCSAGVPLPVRNDTAGQQLVVDISDLGAVASADLAVGDVTPPPAEPQPEPAPPEQRAPAEAPTTVPSAELTTTSAPPDPTTSTTPPPEEDHATAGPQMFGPARARALPEGAEVVLAVTSGTTSDEGSFRASPLSSSSDWQVGVGSGEFSWKYEIPVPAPPAGEAPTVGMGYSSGSVDGLTSTRNTQAGPVGLGFGDFANAFVERRYITCSDDGAARNVLDLCWQSDNAVLALNGRSAELIPVNRTAGPTTAKEWRLASDPAWKVEQLFGAAGDPANGDDDKEWWKVTDRNGTEYWFGRGYNPDSPAQATNSVFWTPTYGNNTGDACQGAICNQGWRWNLDRVVDPNGNVATYTYGVEINKYLVAAGLGGERVYVRSGQLVSIEYGAHTGPTVAPQAKVEFGLQWRCASLTASCTEPKTGADGTQYPDVPVDLLCVENTAQCSIFSPSFFTARRYSQVRTYVDDGGWKQVDEVNLTHSYDPNNDPEVKDKLTLTGLQRKGLTALPNITEPPTTFTYTKLNNRVPSSNNPATLPHHRITQVVDEYGRKVSVAYGHQAGHACTTDQAPAGGWESNTKECFRQQWVPDGDPVPPPQAGVFHKWMVTEVKVEDTTTGSPALTTTYAYEGDPAWHFDTDRFVHTANQGWEDWRGYGTALVTQAGSRTLFRVLRGMHGDRADGAGTLRTVDVASLDDPNLKHRDWNWLAGSVFDEAQLSQGSNPVTLVGTVTTYRTATTIDDDANGSNQPHAEKAAVWTGEETSTRRDRKPDGAFARRRTTTTYNGLLLFPETVEESGWDAPGDERCQKTTYVFNLSEWMLDYPASERVLSGTCAATNGTEVRAAETAYDGGAYGAAPTRGNATRTRQKLTSTAWAETTTGYDALGRSTSVVDPLGRRSTTTYTPALGNARTVINTARAHLADPLEWHERTTEMLLTRGVPSKEIDPNGKATTFGYDAVGRSRWVKQPTEQPAAEPFSWEFVYTVDPDRARPPIVRTRQLQTGGASPVYIESWQVFDSLLRERQTQRMSPAAGMTVVQHTDYDGRGNVASVTAPQAVSGAPGTKLLVPSGSPTPWENRTATLYDELSRPVWEIYYARPPGQAQESALWGTITAHTYNSAKARKSRGGDVTTTRDAYGRVVQIDEQTTRGSDVNPATTRLTYDAVDQLTMVTDPAGRWTHHGYDVGGRRTFTWDNDAGLWFFGHDAAGNQTSVTDARGVATYVNYDDLDREIERRQDHPTSGRLLASWGYDGEGQKGLLDSSTSFHRRPNGEGDEAFDADIDAYDDNSRPTSTTYVVFADRGGLSGTYTVGYGYDRADHRTSVIYPSVSDANGEVLPLEWVVTDYNNLGLPTRVDSNLLPASDDAYLNWTVYDDRARPFWFAYGQTAGGLWKSWSYDNAQRLSATEAHAAVQTPGQTRLQRRTIAYDEAQNVTRRTATVGSKSWIDCYSYDDRNRLTRAYSTSHADDCAASGAGGGDAPLDQSFRYSVDGNMEERIDSASTSNPTVYDYDYTHPATAVNQPPHAPATVDSTVSGQDVTYAWDQNGQMVERKRSPGDYDTLVWTPDRRLDRVQAPNGDAKDAYAYDAAGARVLREAVDRTTFYFEGHEVSATNGGAVTVVRTIGVEGQPVATRTVSKADATSLPTNALSYLVRDNQGSVEMTVKAGENTPAAQRTYTPYGSHTGGEFQTDQGWLGQIEDDRTGLQYLNARFYDPSVNVFLSVDPMSTLANPRTFNPYSYGSNNPTSFVDPSGLCPEANLDLDHPPSTIDYLANMHETDCDSDDEVREEYDGPRFPEGDSYVPEEDSSNRFSGAAPVLNHEEANYCFRHPSNFDRCTQAYLVDAFVATDLANAVYPNDEGDEWSPIDGKRNAFRHCVWLGMMTLSMDAETAAGFADRHEAVPDSPRDTVADEFNNERAMAIATMYENAIHIPDLEGAGSEPTTPEERLPQTCLDMTESGYLDVGGGMVVP